MKILSIFLLAGVAAPVFAQTQTCEPVPFVVPSRMNAAVELSPADVHLDGWLGERILKNERNRLLKVDLEPLLAGYRKKPGTHPWIGEHIGKWMHAATLAWAYTGDAQLRSRLDYAAAELIKTQEADGYLGTYTPDKRFGLYPEADWDVWSHKYCLIGLLTYYQYTGNTQALDAARKAANLLINTFGPGRKSILSAGTHMGMAATSVLEPVVVLYRLTGDERYLAFARHIVESWDETKGPRIIQALLTAKQVNKTANAKAYEMLSNLVGLCELARAAGDRAWLEPVLNAWDDIVEKRLYLTGSASQGEHFHEDYDLPNDVKACVAETCVTTTWIQLNSQLLRLTGDAKFGDELEKTFYNHLAAAQGPRGDDWCYFTPLEGKKKYESEINCCHSSGPRGMALIPQQSYLLLPGKLEGQPDTLAVNCFERSTAVFNVGGKPVKLEQQTEFPRGDTMKLTIRGKPRAPFALAIRMPAWALPMKARVLSSGYALGTPYQAHGWLMIPARNWKEGDEVILAFQLHSELVAGRHTNQGSAALKYGPFVLSYDEKLNGGIPPGTISLPQDATATLKPEFGPLEFVVNVRSGTDSKTHPALFVPFADAGAGGGEFRVWLKSSYP